MTISRQTLSPTSSRRATGLQAALLGVALTTVAAASNSAAVAQEFPARTVRIIQNVSPGGTFDIFTRALANELQKRWGQAVIIEPRPGGNYMIAGRACAESPPDGHTLCALSGETLVYPDFLFKKVPYDARRDFATVTNLFFNTQVLVVNASLGIKSLDDVPIIARKQPLAYVAPAVTHRLFMERFNKKHGIDIVGVPFRGGGEALTGILNGSTPIAIFGGANFAPLIREGTLVGLAVDNPRRSPLFPQVPTLSELGYTDSLNRNYFGIVVPAATPKSIVDRVNRDIVAILNEAEFGLIDRALDPIGDSPEEFARFLDSDRASFGEVARAAKIEPQ